MNASDGTHPTPGDGTTGEPVPAGAASRNASAYPPPVNRLLALGARFARPDEGDRPTLGFGREHIPELIRMATDEALHDAPSSSSLCWAPVHAWWALAELRAEEAVIPLLGLLRRIDDEGDDFVAEDLPEVFAAIGPAALGPLDAYIAAPEHLEYACIAATEAIRAIAQRHPGARPECVARLAAQLGKFASKRGGVNGFLIWALVDLGAVEAAPAMERAFAAGRVDESVVGDWEDVQVSLGLKSHRERPRQPDELAETGHRLRARVEVVDGTAAPAHLADSPLPRILPAPVRKIGRNELCPCGSGRKHKKCCGG